jgi:hypothetical protein
MTGFDWHENCAACGHPLTRHAGGGACNLGGACDCPQFREPREAPIEVERPTELSPCCKKRDSMWISAMTRAGTNPDQVILVTKLFQEVERENREKRRRRR